MRPLVVNMAVKTKSQRSPPSLSLWMKKSKKPLSEQGGDLLLSMYRLFLTSSCSKMTVVQIAAGSLPEGCGGVWQVEGQKW